MYFCLLLSSFVALYSGQTLCVYMGCTDIDYCIFDICGLWMVLVFFYGYVHGYVYGCVWVCVWVMCMDTGSRSSARPGSINIGAYLSLGPVSIIIGTYSLLEARFYHHWDLLASRGPFHHHRVLLLHEARFYHYWDLLLHEARFYHHWDLLASRGPFHHYRVLLLHEAHLNDSPNFSNFSRQKWKNLPQYAMSNKFF
jgi:hypothetical protein